MIYNCKTKTYQQILRRLTPDEMVQAAHEHECKYWHPKMAKLAAKDETRKKKVEKEQWNSWEDDKAQLYMDTHDLRQKRLLETAADLAKASSPEHERETVEQYAAGEQQYAVVRGSAALEQLDADDVQRSAVGEQQDTD